MPGTHYRRGGPLAPSAPRASQEADRSEDTGGARRTDQRRTLIQPSDARVHSKAAPRLRRSGFAADLER